MLLRALDEHAPGTIIVYGSPPPEGRDLDAVVRDEHLPALEQALADAGAVRRGDTWARFADGTAYAVDLVPVSQWRLPDDEVDALWAGAEPLPPYTALARPSAAHTLLVLARIGVSEKRLPRLRAALATPGAREDAQRRAAAWRVDLDAQLEPQTHTRPPVRAPRVVALSGLDGSGKSTQARALAAALEALGYRVHIEWAPILQNRSIELLSSLARVVLRRVRGASAPAEGESLVAQVDAASTKQRAVRAGWTSLVALVNAASNLRPSLTHRGGNTVVIHDRFVLDSMVRLRFLYGRDDALPWQRRLLALLSPRPVAAFWLDVPAEAAYARKPEHWDVDDLTVQRQLYGEEHRSFGVRRLDGERPRDELSAEIAAEVWRRL